MNIRMDEIELAYAVTIPWSQGSEFATVIIPMSWFPAGAGNQKFDIYCYNKGEKKSNSRWQRGLYQCYG